MKGGWGVGQEMRDNPFFFPYKKKLLITSKESKMTKGRIRMFSCVTTTFQKLTCDLRNILF